VHLAIAKFARDRHRPAAFDRTFRAMPGPLAVPASSPSSRYERRRDSILWAATELLNTRGVRGMRLSDVAARLGLTTTSVTYYYRHKEDLVVACYAASLQTYEALSLEAAKEADAVDRVRTLFRLHLELKGQIRARTVRPTAFFGDVRSLTGPASLRVEAAYRAMIAGIASLFETPELAWIGAPGRMARAELLLEQVRWSPAWLGRYSLDDFPRLIERMSDILVGGLIPPARPFMPVIDAQALAPTDETSAEDRFLDAATRVINARGYAGASVEDIAAELNVTKGSFYYRHEAKDDLVIACFNRSFDVMRLAQRQARARNGDEGERLASAVASLIGYQSSPAGPLLRTTAVAALPLEYRQAMLDRADRVAQGFAAMIADGIAEGSIRAVDPHLASHMIIAMINAATDQPEGADTVGHYVRPMMRGLFSAG